MIVWGFFLCLIQSWNSESWGKRLITDTLEISFCEMKCVPCDLQEIITKSYVILLILGEASLSKKQQCNWIIGSHDYTIANTSFGRPEILKFCLISPSWNGKLVIFKIAVQDDRETKRIKCQALPWPWILWFTVGFIRLLVPWVKHCKCLQFGSTPTLKSLNYIPRRKTL